MTTTISSLPDDILYIISKDLGFLSTLALRSTSEDVISVLENCENLQELYILGCKEVKLLPITTAMKNLYQENENLEDKKIMVKKRLQKLKKIVLTRCVGGKRHSFTIKQILEDLQ
ncbi:11909_t:CDS:2, partial [Racocetra fulgida]